MRTTSWRGRVAFLAAFGVVALVVGLGARVGGRRAHGAAAELSAFSGTWMCGSVAPIDATCERPLHESLALTTLTIGPGREADLVLHIGCDCELPLIASPSEPMVATLAAPTACAFLFKNLPISTTVEALTLRLDPAGPRLELTLQAGATEAPPLQNCTGATIQTSMTLVSRGVPSCGPADTAVGVIPFLPFDTDCPFGAGREGLRLTIQDESDTFCWTKAGQRGEGEWVLPQSEKLPPDCRTRTPSEPLPSMTINACRVDGRRFKPLTTDPSASEQFYAVLKLGDAPCSNGSVEVIRTFDTEDDGNIVSSALGRVGPNVVGNASNTLAEFHFCFFRAAATADETMSEFPDLGFPYAVYHDFEGPQPPWVTLKGWQYSRNQAQGNKNRLSTPSDDGQITDAFAKFIEQPAEATYLEMAWVR
jgi:hypothetical protein